MKQILRIFLKVMLLLTLLALAVLLVFGLVLWIGWPWWVGFFVLIGLLGLGLGFILVRKIWVRRREQMFVHQIIEQDEANRQHLTAKEQDTSKELQARWKEAIEALRRSHLTINLRGPAAIEAGRPLWWGYSHRNSLRPQLL